MRAFLLISISLAACGSRALPGTDGSVPLSADIAPAPNNDGSPSPTNGCIIAVRVDTCCGSPFPASVQSLQNDPCVVPYPPKGPIPPQCAAKQPKWCETVDCADGPPVSRLVELVPGGDCQWKDECQSDADCVVAVDYAQPSCCRCPGGYPRELLATEPCLIAAPVTGPIPSQCPPPPTCSGPTCNCPATLASCQKASPSGPNAKNRCVPYHPR